MTEVKTIHIGLVGNPNSGKSSLFNYLTGLRQNVSNFPGVTVEKKTGDFYLDNGNMAEVIDLPGLYSLYPNSAEEKIVVNLLVAPNGLPKPDLILYVADATQLERHLLLATQIADYGYPLIFVLNMADLVEQNGGTISENALAGYLGVPVVKVSVRNGTNLKELTGLINKHTTREPVTSGRALYTMSDPEKAVADTLMGHLPVTNRYQALVIAHHHEWVEGLSTDDRLRISKLCAEAGFHSLKLQVRETLSRYDHYDEVMREVVKSNRRAQLTLTDKIDGVITHKFLGPLIFFLIMFFVFQAIYTWSAFPMDMIEMAFAKAGAWLQGLFPGMWWADLLANGILAGLGGVLVFVPQIAILFLLLSVLEESGYMSRVVFMFDSIMQKFGMNGRSMVALISSGACAIPAIMSTRTISSQKERLITILVSPLISCSARLPVYAVLVGFAVPDEKWLGLFNLQGMAFMGLYMLGIMGALAAALFFRFILRTTSGSYLMMELPDYKPPIWKNVFISVWEKVMSFVAGAGKIIMIISLVLWFLASFGPGDRMSKAEELVRAEALTLGTAEEETNHKVAAARLESSWIGHMGKVLEPTIRPLGFDWKIGIALITSFAAREVFVGTMATIYSIGATDDEKTIRERMAAEVWPGTSDKVYTRATSFALLVFYVFAMQCMSTLAIVRKETGTWKWPVVQFVFMGVLAYFGAMLVQVMVG